MSPAAPRLGPPAAWIRPTAFGPLAVAWTGGPGRLAIVRILISRPGLPADVAAARAGWRPATPLATVSDLAARIAAFLDGAGVRFDLDEVALDRCSPFQQAVLRAEHAIPRGSVTTYRLLAARVGRPAACRAAGRALAANPFPIVVPCHRAVRSDGALGGYQGGLAMKRTLLEREGIAFDPAGRVAVERFHYGP